MRRFLSLLLPLASVAAAEVEFVYGGSFGRPTIGPYNNCSGSLTTRPSDLAIDTLPNINPDDPYGWERWDLSMYQSDLFLSMHWVQGDPASLSSVPAHGTFELVARFSNGTAYRTHTSGQLTYTNSSSYSISIDGNSLSWDNSQTWWNVSLSVDGLSASFETQSIMLDKFSPYAGWTIGQLTEGLFTGIPITRGSSRLGSVVFPWGESIALDAESVLNHMFSTKPIQTVVTNYAIRALRSNGTEFGDAFIYESSRAPNGSQYEAFFLGRAQTEGPSTFVPYTIYAGTNSDILSFDRINTTTTNAQLASCNNTNSNPFSWNYSLPITGPVAEYIDSAGGRTSFYLVTATAYEPFNGSVYPQKGTGLVQIYQAAGAALLQLTPDAGGEQPPNPYK